VTIPPEHQTGGNPAVPRAFDAGGQGEDLATPRDPGLEGPAPGPDDTRSGGAATTAPDSHRGPTEPARVLSVRRRPAEATAAQGVTADGAVPARPRRRSRRGREQQMVWAICAVAAVAGALADVAPTGNRVADRLLAAGFAGLVAAAGSTAKRWTWFVAAGAGLALADGEVAFAAGVAALVLAFASTGPIRPAPAFGAAVGGASAVALLSSGDLWFHGFTAVVAAAAVTPMLFSGYRYAGRRTRRRTRRVALAGAVAVVIVVGVYAVLLAGSRDAVERGIERLEAGMAAARDGDDVLAEERFGEAEEAFATAERALGGVWVEPAELLPVVGHNARAIQAMAVTAHDLSRQGRQVAADADVDGLTIDGGRLDLQRVRALEQPLVDSSTTMDAASARMDTVDTAWLAAPVAERVERIRSEVADARPDADLAADAVRVVPAIFGEDGESRWFVAFVTPVEARGRSGFLGNFAELTAVDGDVEMTRFGRVGELEGGGTPGPERTISGPTDFLARWGKYSPETTWRNITMSPDFPSIGQVVTELYPQSSGRPVDGVIAIDPVALAALLEFTGPVTVPGVPQPLTAENAAQFILVDQYQQLTDTEQRVDVLEDLAEITFDRLTAGELPSPRTVADTLGPMVREGHIQLYGSDPAQQRLFTTLDADGALPPIQGDFLSVVNSNATGNKVDLFLKRDIDYRANWDPTTGEVTATVEVTLTNDAPTSGIPDYVIGNSLGEEGADLPKGTNRTHLSIYSMLQLDGAALDGEAVEVAPEVERDRYAYSLFVDVPPEGGTRTVTLELQGRIAPPGGAYRLDVANQPMVTPDDLRVSVESASGGPLKGSRLVQVEGATASAELRPTSHEITLRVETDE
jgi:hypothetical protein